jgi:hypothetical protein
MLSMTSMTASYATEDTNTRIYIQQSRLSDFMLRSMGNENHSLQSRRQLKERLPSYPYLFWNTHTCQPANNEQIKMNFATR